MKFEHYREYVLAEAGKRGISPHNIHSDLCLILANISLAERRGKVGRCLERALKGYTLAGEKTGIWYSIDELEEMKIQKEKENEV